MTNPFSVNILGGLNVGQEIRQNRMDSERREDKANLARERQQMQDAFAGGVKGDPESMETLSKLNPNLFLKLEGRQTERVEKEGEAKAQAKKSAELDWATQYRQALSNGNQERLDQLVTEAESNPLVEFDHTMIGNDQSKDNLVINSMLYHGLGKDAYRDLVADKTDKNMSAESLAFNDLIKDFSSAEQKNAKRIKAGLKGRAMSNAVLSAIESGDITNLAQAQAEIKQAEKFAELTGSSRGKAIDKGFERINKIDAGVRNIDKAIAVLDRGAGVGAIERFWPSIKAASVELDNIRGQMALDVVGATTFGALSAGELNLAKDVALPTGLNTDQLKDYLERKKVAQSKLRDYYNEQIQFLDQGGTVAGFLRSKEQGLASQQAAPQGQPQQPQMQEQPQQAAPEQTVNWGDL